MLDLAADRSALLLLTGVERRLSAALAADLEREKITLDQWRVVAHLSTSEGRSMRQIGEGVVLPAPTLTKIVDRLVAANVVHRRHDPVDRRRVLVLLTPQGKELRRRLEKIAEEHEEKLRHSLGKAGLEQLNGLLVRLSQA
jgi:DNA-binding MarR family transcriptional regulator